MIEKIFKSLFLTLLFSLLFQPAIADDPKKIGQYVMVSLDTTGVQTIYLEPDEIGRAVFSEKLDDLVSSWYVNNIFLSGTSLDLDFTLHRHIDLPDSVLIRRLQKAEAADRKSVV